MNNAPVMRCKMTFHGAQPLYEGDASGLKSCRFGAVYSPNPAEEDFIYGKLTPAGHVSVNILATVAERLKVGQAYYVDFTEAN